MDLCRKLFFLLRPRERLAATALLSMTLLGAALETFALWSLALYIGLLVNPEAALQQPVVRALHEGVFPSYSLRGFVFTCTLLLACVYLVKNVFVILMYGIQFNFVYRYQISLARRLFSAYLYTDYSFHLRRNSAEILRNINDNALPICHNVIVPLFIVVSEILVVIAISVFLTVSDPLAFVAAVGPAGIMSFFIFWRIHGKMTVFGQAQQYYGEQIIRRVSESLGSIKETKIFKSEAFFLNSYAESVSGLSRAQRGRQLWNQLPRVCVEVAVVVALVSVVGVVALRESAWVVLLPTLGLFAAASFRVMPSFSRMLSMLTNISYFGPAVDIVYRDLMELEVVQDGRRGKSAAGRLEKAIELRDVSYRYSKTGEKVINAVSLTIPRGACAGLIGPSGAGKTTLMDLIMGLLEPSEGGVFVDGRDVRENLDAWQRTLGYVPQDVYILDDSIRRNVTFGLSGEDSDDAKIWQALEQAQLREVVLALEESLDTRAGERGSRLSGGERQRLGIARCLYRDPEVIVLDEPTSSLDRQTEVEVARVIEKLRGRKTIVLISHRESLSSVCDIVFSLRDGALLPGGIGEGNARKRILVE